MGEYGPIQIGRVVNLLRKLFEELLQLDKAGCSAVLKRDSEVDVSWRGGVLGNGDRARPLLRRIRTEEPPEP